MCEWGGPSTERQTAAHRQLREERKRPARAVTLFYMLKLMERNKHCHHCLRPLPPALLRAPHTKPTQTYECPAHPHSCPCHGNVFIFPFFFSFFLFFPFHLFWNWGSLLFLNLCPLNVWRTERCDCDSLCVFFCKLKVVSSGKNSRGYHYILANLVRASNNSTQQQQQQRSIKPQL